MTSLFSAEVLSGISREKTPEGDGRRMSEL